MPTIIEVEDLSIKELEPYTYRSEVKLFRYNEPKPGIFIAESPKVISRALDAGYEPISFLMERKMIYGGAQEVLERCKKVPIYTADSHILAQITGFQLTLGALCAMKRRPLPDMETICAGKKRIAVLEDIVNPTNIGAIFRSAAALNFDAVLLTPNCCDPLYRRSLRVSMGTVFQIPWTFLPITDSGYIDMIKNMGFSTAALVLQYESERIDDPRLMAEERLAVMLGTEGEGLRYSTVRACDYAVEIPMAAGVDSLNVAAASAVAFWQLGKR
ncbi:MAG: RNA methyltransferase [Lachnospiraceae bacterium]|nr:RNA methyltransferase [Lachnospiraceae bacterium]